MSRAAAPLAISDGQREVLESLARSQSAAHRVVQRARALLLAADGVSNSEISEAVGVSRPTVLAWRHQFEEDGLAEFGVVATGRGPKPSISEEKIAEIVELTLHSKPEGQTHWSCRLMAQQVGVSPATVQRIWSARGLKPHLVTTFKLSNDRHFEDKLIDVVGLYLNPPDQAVVLCMDEKSKIQALDRTQPSDLQPDVIHADTQGQSLPVFGLAALLGFELLPRIRNWSDLIFYRPDARTRYQHIDSLFGDNTIDWGLIRKHWPDLLRTGISIREGRLSSVTLLRRLGNHSRRNRLYKAMRELGRVVRTITLLRFLSEPELREQITTITNRVEGFHGFSEWLMIGGRIIGANDPEYHERVVKFNELVANCAIYSMALDITDAANDLAAEGAEVDIEDLATITPYIRHPIRRFGDWVLNLAPPEAAPVTRLDLAPKALFPAGPA
jgi:transposase